MDRVADQQFRDGWVDRQLDRAAADFETWPEWMKQACGDKTMSENKQQDPAAVAAERFSERYWPFRVEHEIAAIAAIIRTAHQPLYAEVERLRRVIREIRDATRLNPYVAYNQRDADIEREWNERYQAETDRLCGGKE
jgi:hypothetical protein